MKQLTIIKAFRFSESDVEIQNKLKEFSVNVPQFIRAAIREKAKRDWKKIKEKKVKGDCPF